AKQCFNGFEAMSYLQQNTVDLVFLDINMPDFTGIDFLESLNYKPHVIITTAYSEYAVKSYEYSVTDYLLKPFSFERFLKGINKILIRPDEVVPARISEVPGKEFIFLKADKVNHKVFFDDINYLEACGNFIKVFFKDQMIMATGSMKHMEDQLPGETFVRVHRSFIISSKKIEQITGNTITINQVEIPVGINYRAHLRKVLSNYNLLM
nr:response regulator transcription factor [Bacteroidota bacterium]